MRTPDFWGRKAIGILPTLLRPIGGVVSVFAAWRQKKTTPWHAPKPVICVGNLVVGGAGKTPVAIDLVNKIKAKKNIHVVMRGYGGILLGPVVVDVNEHTAAHVGDEALLLAQAAPTWVSQDRKAGVKAACDAGADIIILDDGFQNPAVHKDLSLLIVDGQYGFGNGRVMPAGPLRETIGAGLKRADAVVIMGADDADVWGRIQRKGFKNLPILRANIIPDNDTVNLQGQDVFAFTGIGRPQKFFDTLVKMGCTLTGCRAFDDHHPYTHDDIRMIIDAASDIQIITTRKDFVRIPPEFQSKIQVLDIAVSWKHDDDIVALLHKVMNDD